MAVPICSFAGTSRQASTIKAMLEARGSTIEDMDIAIGSVAFALGARVATYNLHHLQRLEGLSIDDWSQSPRS